MAGGFSSLDALITAMSTNGSIENIDFSLMSNNAAAGVAGRWYDLNGVSNVTNNPSPLQYSVTGGSATPCTSAFGNPGGFFPITGNSPAKKFLLNLSAWTTSSTVVPCELILCDYLLYYSGLSASSPTTLTNTNTLPRYTTGAGVMAMVMVTTLLGATTPNITLTYTDNTGATGKTGTLIAPTTSLPVSTMFMSTATLGGPFLPMSGTSYGVRSIQSYTINSGGTATGALAFVLVKPLIRICIPSLYNLSEKDCLFNFLSLPQIQDNAYLGFLIKPGGAMAANSRIMGRLQYAWL